MSPMIYTLYGFAIFFFIFWCGKWLVHLLAISYGKYKLHKRPCNLPRETPLPAVSILKPLMGVDPNLSHNLETFFTMNYPIYELLFCIEDKNDPAIEIAQKLLSKYPKIDAHLFIGGSNVGVNPKINNMNPGYEAAKYDLIMISDSGIKMKDDTLIDMVQHMTDNVGLVHQMPFTCDRDGFAATFEKIFFGTVQSRIYLCADFLSINCHTGMSCLLRKKVIDKLGGLRIFGCYLAEDFFIAKAMTDNKWKMKISSQPALQNSGICDISNFQARLKRWAKLRVAMVPTTILLEPLSECMVVGAFASWSVSILFGWDSLVFYLIHILMWFLSDWILLSIVQNGSLPFNKFDFVVGWLFRELSGPYLFLHALWNPAIRWRTRVYKLAWGGIAYELSNSIHNTKMQLSPKISKSTSTGILANSITTTVTSLKQQQQLQQLIQTGIGTSLKSSTTVTTYKIKGKPKNKIQLFTGFGGSTITPSSTTTINCDSDSVNNSNCNTFNYGCSLGIGTTTNLGLTNTSSGSNGNKNDNIDVTNLAIPSTILINNNSNKLTSLSPLLSSSTIASAETITTTSSLTTSLTAIFNKGKS